MKLFGLALLCGVAAFGQTVSVGAIGGVPFTDAVNTAQNSSYSVLYTGNNYIVGPSLQVNLPAGLRLEVDGLFRPVSYQLSLPFATATSISATQWQFPFLMQYRLKTPRLKPFLEAGLSFDHLSGISSAATAITSGPGQVPHTGDASVVLGGGVEVKIPFIRLSGELRYFPGDPRGVSDDFES